MNFISMGIKCLGNKFNSNGNQISWESNPLGINFIPLGINFISLGINLIPLGINFTPMGIKSPGIGDNTGDFTTGEWRLNLPAAKSPVSSPIFQPPSPQCRCQSFCANSPARIF